MEEWIVEKEDIATGDPGEDDHDTERIVGEWFQNRNLFHARDDIPGEDFRGAIIIELLFRECVHLFPGHVPNIREIDGIDGDETNHEDGDIFLRIGESEFQSLSFRNIDGGTESIENGHDAEYRENEYGRELHDFCETEDDASDDEVPR